MPADTDPDTDSNDSETTADAHPATGTDSDPAATVPAVDGDDDHDYAAVCEEFGAEPLTDGQVARFPDHPLVRRRVFYAGRDVDRYLDAAAAGATHSVVTGRGPSGPMHLGHVLPFYFARRLQEATGATVYVPLSDDEKYLDRDQTLAETADYVRDNLRDLLAVGFDPERTRVVVDTADADVVYPVATAFAERISHATLTAVYGEPPNVGMAFYPAVQAAHLLLPQLVDGGHPTLVPVAVDQDPHVRVCRDVAAAERFPVTKPAALLGKFLPGLDGPGKMSTSGDRPTIGLTDDRDAVFEAVRRHAHSGGRSSVADHRERGGDPGVDVAYQYLAYFFEDDDAELRRLARAYRAGDLLSGELKDLAAGRIADFLAAHRDRRAALGPVDEELAAYRLTDDERERALAAVGVA